MTTKLNVDIVHEIYVNDNEFYVLIESPYVITADVSNRRVFVHERTYSGFKQLNPNLNIYPYKYNAIRISPHPFMDEYNRLVEEYYKKDEEEKEPDEPVIPDDKKINSKIDIWCDDPDIKPIKSIKDIIYRCNNEDSKKKQMINRFDNYDEKMFVELKREIFNRKTRSNNIIRTIDINKQKRVYSISKNQLTDHIFGNGRHYSMRITTNSNDSIEKLLDNSKITIHVPIDRESLFKEKWKDLSDNINGETCICICCSVKKYKDIKYA